MNKYLVALAITLALSACSSDSSDDGEAPIGNADAGTVTPTPDTGTSPVVTDGGPIAPTGTITGAWFGNNHYGEGVMIVDAAGNVSALATNGAGGFEAAFGPANGTLQRFVHRTSDNPAFAESFTLAGDIPSSLTGNVADNTVAYSLSTADQGQSISNAGAAEVTMAFATENDLGALSLDSIAGTWGATTSFCAADCNITLLMTIGADGSVTGSTQFNDGGLEPLVGTVTAAQGATQYLNISFTWTEKQRTGVLHLDRLAPTRLVVNTFGPADTEGEFRSFTATMIRR